MKRLSIWVLFPLFLFTLLQSGCPNREPVAPVEITRPRLKSFSPAAATLMVPVNAKIEFQFTEPMNLASFENKVRLYGLADEPIPGTISQVDSTVFFTPTAALEKAMVFTLELRGGIRDARLNTLEAGGEAAFSDTTVVASSWFFSEGDYSIGGFNAVFLRDRKEGSLRRFTALDSLAGSVSGFSAPEDAVVTPDGRLVAVANTGKNEIAFVNSSTLQVEKTLAVAANPSQVETSSDYLYVVSVNGKAVSKINLSTLNQEGKFTVNFFPGKLALSQDGAALFTLDQVKRDLIILNTATGLVSKTVPAVVDKLLLGEIRTDSHSGLLYICDAKGLKVKRTDANGAAPETIYVFPGGSEPLDIACGSAYHFVVAGKTLYKYDALSHTPVSTCTFATACKAVTLLPTEDVLYVTLATSIVVMDAQTLTILSEVSLASSGIEAMVVNPVKMTN